MQGRVESEAVAPQRPGKVVCKLVSFAPRLTAGGAQVTRTQIEIMRSLSERMTRKDLQGHHGYAFESPNAVEHDSMHVA